MSPAFPAGLRASLAVLALIVAIALIGLGAAGNWPKVLRVAAAAVTYAVVLLLLSRGRAAHHPRVFVAAGAVAGAVSGLARPTTSVGLVAASMLGAALLLGPMHWWALRNWERQAQRTTSP
jgi:hypothetical protein